MDDIINVGFSCLVYCIMIHCFYYNYNINTMHA